MSNPIFARSVGIGQRCRLCVKDRRVTPQGKAIRKERVPVPGGRDIEVCPYCDNGPDCGPPTRILGTHEPRT